MRRLSVAVVLLFLFQLGASVPQDSRDAKQASSDSKGSRTKKSLTAMTTPQALGDQIVKFFGRKTGKELMMERSGSVAGAGAAVTKALSSETSSANEKPSSVKPDYVPPPPTPRVAVPQIRQELQKIFDLNKKIKNLQNGRSAQLQHVQEQARIHQKILDQLESSQKQVNGQKASSRNALLAQEKLRIIHEETQRNTRMIDSLKGNPAGRVSKTVEKIKTTAS